MMIAAVVCDAGDFDARIEEQIARVLEPQIDLMTAKWFPKFLNEKTSKMSFAAVKLLSEFG